MGADTSIRNDVFSASRAVSVVSASAIYDRSRGIWIGTTQSIDLCLDGSSWVLFQGATAGTILPIQAVGARKTAGSAAFDAGDCVFVY